MGHLVAGPSEAAPDGIDLVSSSLACLLPTEAPDTGHTVAPEGTGLASELAASCLACGLPSSVAPDTGHAAAVPPAGPAESAAPWGSAPTRVASPVSSALAARKGHLDMAGPCWSVVPTS